MYLPTIFSSTETKQKWGQHFSLHEDELQNQFLHPLLFKSHHFIKKWTCLQERWVEWDESRWSYEPWSPLPGITLIMAHKYTCWGWNFKELLPRNKLRFTYRLNWSWSSVHDSYCSNIELGGLTWALLSVPMICMRPLFGLNLSIQVQNNPVYLVSQSL